MDKRSNEYLWILYATKFYILWYLFLKTGGGKFICPYCLGCPKGCTNKWTFSRIHYVIIIRTSKKMHQVKNGQVKSQIRLCRFNDTKLVISVSKREEHISHKSDINGFKWIMYQMHHSIV